MYITCMLTLLWAIGVKRGSLHKERKSANECSLRIGSVPINIIAVKTIV